MSLFVILKTPSYYLWFCTFKCVYVIVECKSQKLTWIIGLYFSVSNLSNVNMYKLLVLAILLVLTIFYLYLRPFISISFCFCFFVFFFIMELIIKKKNKTKQTKERLYYMGKDLLQTKLQQLRQNTHMSSGRLMTGVYIRYWHMCLFIEVVIT